MPCHAARLLVLTVAILVVSIPGFAQVADHFDTSRTVTVTGGVARLQIGAVRTILVLRAADEAGVEQRWVVEANGVAALTRDGWPERMGLGPGTVLTITALPLRETAAIDEVLAGAPDDYLEAARAGRFVRGLEATLADGTTRPLGSMD